jgi:hypothetical protein
MFPDLQIESLKVMIRDPQNWYIYIDSRYESMGTRFPDTNPATFLSYHLRKGGTCSIVQRTI